MADPVTDLDHYPNLGRTIDVARPHRKRLREDPAKFVVDPDDIIRPWLATPPNGSAFVWQTGIEGFDINSTATIGIHHYIGKSDIDATVIFPDETHISLTGTFPGRTSSANMLALREVIREETPPGGKILSLPGILKDIAFVAVENYRFTHEAQDNSHSIGYEISFVRVGVGPENEIPITDPLTGGGVGITVPSKPPASRGRVGVGRSITAIVGAGASGGGTLRSVAIRTGADQLEIVRESAKELSDAGILPHLAFLTPFTAGTRLKIPI